MPSAIRCFLQDNSSNRRALRAPRRAAAAACAALLLTLAACSGGSSGDPPPSPPPPPPATSPGTLSLSAPAYEVDESSTTASFMVTRAGGSDGEVSVDIMASEDSATAGVDFGTITTTATFTDGDTTAKTGTVAIFDDNDEEPDETIILTLSNVTGGATIGAQDTAVITIRDDDAPAPPPGAVGHYLNDTGVATCSNDILNLLSCNDDASGTDEYPAQDAEYGRDTTDGDDADGRGGFSFTKLDSDGNPLADQTGDYATQPWDCVRDEVTGLVWEIKSADGALRDAGWRYSWHEQTAAGFSGEPAGGTCADAGQCDTDKFAAAVNAAGLCGFDDWRLPDREELLSLVDFASPDPVAVDMRFFPNTPQALFWTRSANSPFDAHYVGFVKGESFSLSHRQPLAVRLVTGGI